MIKLKKIGLVTTGYVFAIFSFISALFQVLLNKIQTLIPAFAAQMNADLATVFNGSSFWIMLVSTPLLGIVTGFVIGVLFAAIYNIIVVPICGGFEVEFSEPKKK